MIRRIVFDTSTLVSAAIRPDSLPDQALSLALMNHVVYTSAVALDELQRTLTRAKFDKYASGSSRLLFFEKFQRDARQIEVSKSASVVAAGVCRDPNDQPFLALGFAAQADVLVSGDDDLLTLHSWHDIEIVTASHFVNQYGREAL